MPLVSETLSSHEIAEKIMDLIEEHYPEGERDLRYKLERLVKELVPGS